MPSHMKIITPQLDAGGKIVRALISPTSTRVTQITPIVLPDTAAGLCALQIGSDGDPVPLMIQGQTFNLDGVDQTGGLWLMQPGGTFVGPAIGELQFFLAVQE